MENQNTTKKLLLLNPPGSRMFFRDYYCAKVSKARYYYHPVDLVYLSGSLSEHFQVSVIDAIAEKMDISTCRTKILSIGPDIVIFLSSAPSYKEDMMFISEMKALLQATIMIGTGDIFREYKEFALQENKIIDALLLDFSTQDIITYLLSEEKTIPNIIKRDGEEIINGGEKHLSGSFDLPLPRWDLFNLKAYHFPFARKIPYASILTDFGCPFSCDFCPVSTLGYKLRSISSVIDELRILKKLGVKELYIRDQTFGVNKQRTLDLLRAITIENFKFGWTCLSRTDILDAFVLKLMKEAGCHTIMIGIESANEQFMISHNKNTTTHQTHEAISLIKKAGIRAGGFFMIGFPGETRQSINDTIDLACSLNLDYASFNIVNPRFGTSLRKTVIEKGSIYENILDTESSFSKPVWKNQPVSNDNLLCLKKYAVRKFYLRPGYLFKRLLNIKTFHETKNLFAEAVELLRKNK